MTTQDRIIKTMLAELKGKYKNNRDKYVKELNKVQRFIKSSEYFKGHRRDLYKLIINAKKN